MTSISIYLIAIASLCLQFEAPSPLPELPGLDTLGDPLAEGARLQFGTKRFRPPGNVLQLMLSPDQRTLISMDDFLIAWDAKTGKERWRVSSNLSGNRSMGAGYGLRPMVFAPDGSAFFTIGKEGKVMEWSLDSPLPKQLFQLKRLANKSDEGEMNCIDVTSSLELFAIGNSDGLTVADSNGRVLYQWDNVAEGGARVDRFKSDDRLEFWGGWTLLRFSPDDSKIAFVRSKNPRELIVIDSEDGTEEQVMELEAKAVRLDFSPDGKQIVVTERDNAVRLYEVETGKRIWSFIAKLDNPFENYTSDVAFSPDGTKIVAGATDNRLYVLDPKNGQELGNLVGHAWYPWTLAFSGDGQTLYSSGWDGKIRRWNMQEIKGSPYEGIEYGVSVIAASPDGKQIAVPYESGRIAIVSAIDGKEEASIGLEKEKVSQIVYSYDASYLAAGGEIEDRIFVVIWNSKNQTEICRWEWPKGKDPHSHVEALAFSPDGKRIAAAVFRQSKAFLWEIETKKKIADLKHQEIYGLDFSSDGQSLITVGWDSHLREWDATSGEPENDIDVNLLMQKQSDQRMYAVSCAAGGDLIATAHMDATIKIWNRDDMSLRTTIDVRESFSYGALRFSRDGLWLVSGGNSGNVSLWEPWSGELAMQVGAHQSHVYHVDFGRDLRTLYSGGDDGMCYQWDLLRPSADPRADMKKFWEILQFGNAKEGFQAMQTLSTMPEATDFLRKKLSPVQDLVEVPQDDSDEDSQDMKRLIEEDPDLEFSSAVRRSMTILSHLEDGKGLEILKELAKRGQNDPVGKLAIAALYGKATGR